MLGWARRSRVLRDRVQESREAASAARIAELTRSRRSVAEAYERERRRIERDLHDGAQQYFVAAAMALGEAEMLAEEAGTGSAPGELARELARARKLLGEGLTALRTTVHGIHPQVLVDEGLAAAVGAVAASYGSHVQVRAPHPLPELPAAVLAAAYFFASEALTNCARHAPGAPVTVLLTADSELTVSVVDRGPGGAEVRPGGGLAEMSGRLEAFDGTVTVHSPAGGPTQVVARIPLLLHRGEPGLIGEES